MIDYYNNNLISTIKREKQISMPPNLNGVGMTLSKHSDVYPAFGLSSKVLNVAF
jgi:hypothetical protein